MYAHYYKAKQQGTTIHMVVIGTSMQPIGTTYKVESKADATALAKQHNAKPWNF